MNESETDKFLPDPPQSNLLLDKMSKSVSFRTCKILCKLFTMIITKFWKISASSCLILFLMYWFYGGVVTLIFLMLSIFGIFYYSQDMFLYYPCQPPNSRILVEKPERFKLPCENVYTTTPDGATINMYLIKHTPSLSQPTVILLHGNAGNIGHRLMIAYYIYNACRCNVLLLEYRGYGKSTGKPTESGLYTDAETALKWLCNRVDIDSQKIFVYGSSLGGAVSIKLCSDSKYMTSVAGLILENTFTSIPDVARGLFNMKVLDFVPFICYKNQFPSEYRIGKVTIPTLFLSGQNDELIPPRMMSALYNLSGSKKKRLVPFEGGTHNETCLCPGFYEAFGQFVYEVCEHPKPLTDDVLVPVDPSVKLI